MGLALTDCSEGVQSGWPSCILTPSLPVLYTMLQRIIKIVSIAACPDAAFAYELYFLYPANAGDIMRNGLKVSAQS
jgi:hypothetical protein